MSETPVTNALKREAMVRICVARWLDGNDVETLMMHVVLGFENRPKIKS